MQDFYSHTDAACNNLHTSAENLRTSVLRRPFLQKTMNDCHRTSKCWNLQCSHELTRYFARLSEELDSNKWHLSLVTSLEAAAVVPMNAFSTAWVMQSLDYKETDKWLTRVEQNFVLKSFESPRGLNQVGQTCQRNRNSSLPLQSWGAHYLPLFALSSSRYEAFAFSVF